MKPWPNKYRFIRSNDGRRSSDLVVTSDKTKLVWVMTRRFIFVNFHKAEIIALGIPKRIIGFT